MTDQATTTDAPPDDPASGSAPSDEGAKVEEAQAGAVEAWHGQERRHLVPGLDIPIIPAADELRGLAALAVTLAAADAVPAALRGKPNDVFQVLLTGRDLGVALTTAMREFHVIDGKVTLSPKVKNAMVNERGRVEGWATWPDPGNDNERAIWYATRRDRPGITFRSEFSMTEADGIVTGTRNNKTTYLSDKDNWKNYPKRMLSWRALGYLLDDVFPEVGTGLYSPDELGAMTDEDGNPVIDVASTEPLPGTRAPRGHHAGQPVEVHPSEVPMAEGEPELYAAFRARIERIKTVESAAADLTVAWRQVADLPPFGHVQVMHRAKVDALLTRAEKSMKAGDYGLDGQRAMMDPAASTVPPDEPEGPADGAHPPADPPPEVPAPDPAPSGYHDAGCSLASDHVGSCVVPPTGFTERVDAASARRRARAAQVAAEAGIPGPGTLPSADPADAPTEGHRGPGEVWVSEPVDLPGAIADGVVGVVEDEPARPVTGS